MNFLIKCELKRFNLIIYNERGTCFKLVRFKWKHHMKVSMALPEEQNFNFLIAVAKRNAFSRKLRNTQRVHHSHKQLKTFKSPDSNLGEWEQREKIWEAASERLISSFSNNKNQVWNCFRKTLYWKYCYIPLILQHSEIKDEDILAG